MAAAGRDMISVYWLGSKARAKAATTQSQRPFSHGGVLRGLRNRLSASFSWCPGWDLNPHFPYGKTDFKSVASASFATRAGLSRTLGSFHSTVGDAQARLACFTSPVLNRSSRDESLPSPCPARLVAHQPDREPYASTHALGEPAYRGGVGAGGSAPSLESQPNAQFFISVCNALRNSLRVGASPAGVNEAGETD